MKEEEPWKGIERERGEIISLKNHHWQKVREIISFAYSIYEDIQRISQYPGPYSLCTGQNIINKSSDKEIELIRPG